MKISFQNNDLIIEVFEDSAYVDSVDSPTTYGKTIQADKDKAYSPTSKHGIHVYRDGVIIASAIILASGGGTGIHDGSALVDQENLIIRCCNKLFSLSLPELNINWMAEPDWATCFSIHQYQDTYISHGEMAIARIDRNGNILWKYGGLDIFVNLEGGPVFEMKDDYIELTDFDGNKYRIDYNGKTIDHIPNDQLRQKQVGIVHKAKKPWWRFW